MLYLQKYLRNFQKLSFGWKWWRWLFWLKISCAQTFCFCNSNVTTFPTTRKCKNFNFSLYTIPAEMLYLQKYLTNFQKLSFGWKMSWSKWLFWFGNGWKFQVRRIFWRFAFAIATLPLFQHPENVIISIFPLHCPGRNAISSKVFNEFSKTFFFLKDEEGGYSVWKFHVHRYFAYPIATLPLFQPPENVKISIFPFTLSQQKCYISKVYNEFSKTLFWLKDEEGGYSVWKFKVRRYFGFAIATLPLFQHPENVKISIFPFTMFRQ